MSEVKLYLGDCLEILPTVEAGSVDAVITDPPYPDIAKDFRITSIDLLDEIDCKQLIFWSAVEVFPLDWTAVHIWHKPNGQSSQHYERIFERKGNKVCRVYRIPIINYRTLPEWTPHPTQKPRRLMKCLIEKYTSLGDTILDPFMGSGTTGVACVQLRRNFIGIEIEPKYYDIAEKRIKQAQQQMVMDL